MKATFPICCAALTIAAGCGAPGFDEVENEPIGSTEQAVAAPYRIAVLHISQTNKARKNAASFGTFTSDFTRIMQDKIYAAMDFYGPYHATPAQIGCNGNSNHDNPLIEARAMAMAQAAGVWLGPYRHIWFVKDADLLPGCAIGGSSGGHWFTSPGYGVNSRVGYVTNFSNNVVAMHEFEHGFYGPSLNSHLGVASCPVGGVIGLFSSWCTFNSGGSPGGAPQSVWALGTAGPVVGTPALYNENPIYKSFWNQYGLLPSSNLTPIPQAVGNYTYTLHADDAPIPPAGNWMTVYLPLPSLPGSGGLPARRRSVWFEYRKTAQIGKQNENRPGIYVYYQEDIYVSVPQGTTLQPTANLIRLTNYPDTQSGLGPLPKGIELPIAGVRNVTATVPAAEQCTGATCTVNVRIWGPLE